MMAAEKKIKEELNLLIYLCRLEFSDYQVQRIISGISSVSDWNYFTEMANAHGVGALICHNLSSLGLLKEIPVSAADHLRNLMMLNIARNSGHLEHFREVLYVLNSAGIKTVILKGLALELTVYGNIGLRQMTDVDILISKEESIKAMKLLLSHGFKSLPLKSPLHSLIIRYTGKHLPSLLKGDFSIEIHHDLFGGGKEFLTTLLYEGSFEKDAAGGKAYIPPAQLFFLYLIRHLSYHEMNNESQLRLYADLAMLLEKYGRSILNDGLLSLAGRAGIEMQTAEKLNILNKYWGFDFPEQIDSFIKSQESAHCTQRFTFFLESPKGNLVPERDIPYKYIIKDIPGLHRKIIYVLGDIFPSVGFMKKRYKCRSSWGALLYYPHRLGKLWYLIKPASHPSETG